MSVKERKTYRIDVGKGGGKTVCGSRIVLIWLGLQRMSEIIREGGNLLQVNAE